MSSQLELTLIAALGAGLVASVLTSVVNYFIHRSNLSWQRKQRLLEREQWILDKKTAEYRELLSTLAGSVESMARNSPDFGMASAGSATDEQLDAYEMAAGEGRKIIRDRIFISKSMEDADIRSLWKVLAGTRDMSEFWKSWDWLHGVIIKAAHRELGIMDDRVP